MPPKSRRETAAYRHSAARAALWRGWLDIVMMRVSNIILGWAAQLMSMLL